MIKLVGHLRQVGCDVLGCRERVLAPTSAGSAGEARAWARGRGWHQAIHSKHDRTLDLCPQCAPKVPAASAAGEDPK